MNAPAALLTIRLLILDTFRQARASGILWIWLAATALCVLLCLSVSVSGDVVVGPTGPGDRAEMLPRSELRLATAAIAGLVGNGVGQSLGVWSVPPPFYSSPYQQVLSAARHGIPLARGQMTLAFGAIPIEISRDRHHAVRELECALAGSVLDSVGLLLVLLWTSGFLPSFVEPHSVMVLLAKPVPRWSLLAGKYLGAVVFVAVQGFVFVAGTWLALGLRTGVWDAEWFLCVPLFVLHFAVFYSFSALLAVTTRSTVASAFGAILFWLTCWGMNFARHSARLVADLEGLRQASSFVEFGYWLLPKPLDFHLVLARVMQADEITLRIVDVNALSARGAWSPELSLAASAVAGVVLLGLAAYEFVYSEY